jgi:hypothetical protein
MNKGGENPLVRFSSSRCGAQGGGQRLKRRLEGWGVERYARAREGETYTWAYIRGGAGLQ